MQTQTKPSTSAEYFPLIEKWKLSQMSQTSFCTAQNLPIHIFRYWLDKYRNQTNDTDDKFIPIRMKLPISKITSPLEIHYPNGVRIVLDGNTDARLLKTLINSF
jgi:hypothetical protein